MHEFFSFYNGACGLEVYPGERDTLVFSVSGFWEYSSIKLTLDQLESVRDYLNRFITQQTF